MPVVVGFQLVMDMLPLEGVIGNPVVEEREGPLMCIHMDEHWATYIMLCAGSWV